MGTTIAERLRIALACGALAVANVPAVTAAESARHFTDLVYATVDGKALGLDLHLPAGVAHPPLLVFVHGGAWTTGSKTQYPTFLMQRGFAVASVDFRSSNDAPFPADVFDIKAAIRYLRAQAAMYGYRTDRIAIVGASSGAHLAQLVGLTNGAAALEGTEGDYRTESSSIQAIVSYFGASDLTTLLAQSTPVGLAVREPALKRLLGAAPDQVPDLAKLASPIFHVDGKAPPIMLLHGDQDTQMPLNQVYEMQWAYEQAGLHAEVLILHGVDHDAVPFFRDAPVDRVVKFLKHAIDHAQATTSVTEQVLATERAFAKTMAARNQPQFSRFISAEAVFFSESNPLRGKSKIVDGWSKYFKTPQAPFSWEPSKVEVLESGSLALSTGPVRDPSGKLIGTFTSIWRLEAPNTWRIVFDKGNDVCAK
jgi:acetyl esterase/lipase